MRVLILSCNTGEGHNSCGKAIQEAFRARQIPCEMEDAFRFISSRTSRAISTSFVWVYRHTPGLFRFGYQYTEEHPRVFRERSPVYRMLTAGAERLYRFIMAEGYDTVICTHVFSALIVTEILNRHQPDLRTAFVATDYTCSPSCGQSRLDTYFIPDPSLVQEFIRCGIPGEKLVASGIPIRKEFFHAQEKALARQKTGLSPDCRHLLIMCGSMGCGPLRKLVAQIAADLPDNCCVSVICGTNRQLRTELEADHGRDPRIRIFGFVSGIPELMDSADLYLTKPGGLSTTEAACKHLPMVFVNAVAGCESHNLRFFLEKQMAVTADSTEALSALATSLLTDEAALADMAQRSANMFPQPPAEHIVQCMLQPQPGEGAPHFS